MLEYKVYSTHLLNNNKCFLIIYFQVYAYLGTDKEYNYKYLKTSQLTEGSALLHCIK